MRIGVLSCDLTESHGWGTYSLEIIQRLQNAGVEIQIVAASNSPRRSDLPVLDYVLPGVVPAQRGLLYRQILLSPSVGRLLKDCDIIHSTIEPYAPLAYRVAHGRPYFVTAHGSFVQSLPQRRWPAGWLYGRALGQSHLICVSHYTASVAQQVLPGVQTSVIANGISAMDFNQPPTQPIQIQGPTVLSVGPVKARKGTLELVRAIAVVRETIPDVQCVIIGDLNVAADYMAQVYSAISSLNLAAHVQLLGRVDAATLAGWYAAADLFVLPSMNVGHRFEGFGLVYLEASAAGLPVIGTTNCGAEDAINDGVTGLLIPQSAVTAVLPDAIITLLRDKARARQLGAAGRDWARRHTWEGTVQKLIGVYKDALR